MKVIGLRMYSFDDGFTLEKSEEGKKIVDQYKQEKLLMFGKQKKTTKKKKILPDID